MTLALSARGGSRTVAVIFRARHVAEWLTGTFVVAFVALFGTLSVLRHNRLGTRGFDLGIYDQIFWLISRGKTFSTVRGMPVWGHHINLVAYLYAPFYWMGAGARFLLLTQSVSLGLAAIPAYRLANRRFASPRMGCLFALVTVGYAPLQWLTWSDFHPETLAVSALMFAWWYAEDRRWFAFSLASIFALSTREEAAILVGLLALRAFLHGLRSRHSANSARSDRLVPLAVGLSAVVWFTLCSNVLLPHFNHGRQAYYVTRFYGAWGRTTGEVFKTVVSSPRRVLHTLTLPDRRAFFGNQFVLASGFSVFAPGAAALAIPAVFSTGLARHWWTHDLHYQYTVYLIPVILMSAIEGASRIYRRLPSVRRAIPIWLGAVFLWGQITVSPLPFGTSAAAWKGDSASQHIRAALVQIPNDAAVAASQRLVPHLAQRDRVYVLPNPIAASHFGDNEATATDPNSADWFIARKTTGTSRMPGPDESVVRALAAKGLVSIVEDDEVVLVARRIRTIQESDVVELRTTYTLDRSEPNIEVPGV